MAEFSTTSDNLDQADEDILNPTVSDEAIEAAAADAHLQAQNTFQYTCNAYPGCGGF
jgi:hypothetical protein